MGLWRGRDRRREGRDRLAGEAGGKERGRERPDPERDALYQHVFAEAFRAKYTEGAQAVEIAQADIRRAVRVLTRDIRRSPELVSRMRGRSGLPRSVTDRGFSTVQIVERGVCRLVVDRETIDLTHVPLEGDRVLVATKVPSLIARHVRWDGPSVLSVLNHARAFEDFFGHPCFLLQPALQSIGTGADPVEAEYLFLLEEGSKDVTVPVTVGGDLPRGLAPHRIRASVRAALRSFPDLEVRPLSVTLEEGRRLLLVEYEWRLTETGELEIEPRRSRRYRFEPQLLGWRQ